MADIDSRYSFIPEKTDTTKLNQGIWQGPADGSAPGCVVKQGPWETVTQSNMSAEDIDKVMQIIKDASGNESMEIQPVNYGNESDQSVKVTIARNTKDMSAEQQKKVADGVNGILERDPKKIQQFMEKATAEEKAAFFKTLKDLGYKVEHTPPSPEEQMRIGGVLHDHYRISKPSSILCNGILITTASSPSMGPFNRPSASVSFER